MPYSKTWTDSVTTFPWRFDRSGTFGAYSESGTSSFSGIRTRSGDRVEDWRGKIQRGEFAASPFSCDYQIMESSKAGATHVSRLVPGYNYVRYDFSGNLSNPGSVDHLLNTVDVENAALMKILEKIKHEQQHADSMVAIAEMGDVIRQFGAPFSAILELSNRRLNRISSEMRGIRGVQRKIRFLEIVTRSYLEYAFGLAPLIEDTRKTAEALARWKAEKAGELPQPTHLELKATARQRQATNVMGSVRQLGASWLWYRDYTKVETEVGCRYTVHLKHSLQADFGSNERLLQLLGFDPMNWVPTIYEVIPWSWLADYFLNIGNILEAGFTDTSHVEWIQKTVRRETVKSTTIRQDPDYTRSTIGGSGYVFDFGGLGMGSSSVKRITLNRTLPSTLGVPQLTLSYPNSWAKLANTAAALMNRRPKSNAPLWVF